MLFEIRDSIPEVSADWRETRSLFLSGKVREARRMADMLRERRCVAVANDLVLNIEIARAGSSNKTYMALVRSAMRRFPDDAIVQLYHARVLLTRQRHIQGIDFLRERESSFVGLNRALWAAELANLYGNAGFEASSRRWLDKLDREPGNDAPLALYSRACACEGMQQWDDAIRFARRSVEAAPDWSRARVNLVHCLLTRGRIDEAREEVAEGRRRGHEEALLDVSAAMLAYSTGNMDEARRGLEAALANWPEADFARWLRRTLCILLVECGESAAARDVACGKEKELALPDIPETLEGKHRFIPLPLVSQNKNQCVPTSVAMAVYPQGGRFDPDQLFREMKGREGTTLWRMREWVERNGFKLIPVKLEREGIVELLDRDIPLIGVLEGPFNSHVDVVCGYNDDLQSLYVRDPGHWATITWPDEIALKRYELHGGLLAVVESRNGDTSRIAERWKSPELESLLDLSQAVAEGNRVAAEEAYARISDDGPTAFVRDGFGVLVTITPGQCQEQMKRLAANVDANPVARFRALMSMGNDESRTELARLLDQDDEKIKVGAGGRRFLTLLLKMQEGSWRDALRLIDQLLLTGGGIGHFWNLKSDVLAELGDHEGSRHALDMAIELEPQRMSYREKALQRAATRLTLAEYLDEFDTLLAGDPDDKRLLWGRAAVLQDGPDGLAFERAARDYMRWFPRDPMAYANLLNWYELQGRQDFVQSLLAEAHGLMPDVFNAPESPGKTDRVETPDESASESGSAGPDESGETPESTRDSAALDKPESDEPLNPDDEANSLPTERHKLLELIWRLDDPRRSAALKRLLAMQEAGEMHWHEQARLVACRLLHPDDHDAKSPADPSILLPNPPPGAAHWFAGVVSETLTDRGAPIGAALAVIDWMNDVVGDVTPYPELWFNRVLLHEEAGQMERALADLQALLDRYPASSSALYRMGVVKLRQEDYPASRASFDRALDVNPGLYGAMFMLRKVHETLGDVTADRECVRKLRKKFPYDFQFLHDETLATVSIDSVEQALELVDSASGSYPDRRLAALRARTLLNGGRTDEAASQLSTLDIAEDEPDENLYEDYLQTRMDLAMATKDEPQIMAVCEQGLRRWPNSTRLKEILAEQIAESDVQRSTKLLRDVLLHGQPTARTAWMYLRQTTMLTSLAATQLVKDADEDRRPNLIELLSDVTSHHSLLHAHESFLEWAAEFDPTIDKVQWKLALHYNLTGRTEDAIRFAERIYEQHPNNPDAIRMLGRCWIERDARKALEYLKEACEQNRSTDFLFDLARCHSIAGNKQESIELHWEILRQNPYSAASWTNLFLFEGDGDRLWPLLAPMLERGIGADDEYFLVAAVLVAIKLRKTLPADWLGPALERYTVLKTRPGFRDETSRLVKAIRAWLAKRPADRQRVDIGPRDSLLASLAARFIWPRLRWIPSP